MMGGTYRNRLTTYTHTHTHTHSDSHRASSNESFYFTTRGLGDNIYSIGTFTGIIMTLVVFIFSLQFFPP